MKKNNKKIGFLGLTLELYKNNLPELMSLLKNFHEELKKNLKVYTDVVSYGPVYGSGELKKIFEKFSNENISGVIVVLLSYSPSLLVLPFLKELKKPILIWNTQKISEIKNTYSRNDLLENHGMHGVQDLASVLLREGIRFDIVTGYYNDKQVQEYIKDWIISSQAVNKLENSRIGNIGGTFPLMGDFLINPEELKKQLGVEIINISMEEIADAVKSIRNSEVEKIIKEDLKKFKASQLSKETHERSVKLELALKKIIKRKSLDGISLNFQAFNDCPLETVPFLAVSKFLSEGLGYGGEGDSLTASSVLLLQYLAGQANFVEMFTTDYTNNLILMNHMAESNPAMARKDRLPVITENPLIFNKCKPSAVLSFTLEPGLATLLNFTQNNGGKIKFITAKVRIMDRPPLEEIDSPHFFIKIENKVEDFLSQYSCEGGTHHLALAYGDHVRKIEMVSKILGLKFIKIEGGVK